MRWLKRNMWKMGIALAGLLILLVFTVWIPMLAGAYEGVSGLAMPVTATVQATPTIDVTATMTALNEEKLQHENDWWWNYGATIVSSFLSTLVIAISVLFGFWQWRVSRRDTQANEAKARQVAQDKELDDRKAERERRDDDRLQNTIAGLGSERIEARAVAASMLLTFLQQPGYERFHQQIFNLAVTNLRLRHVDRSTPEPLDSLSQALITVFKESFPLARKALMDQEKSQFDHQDLDASHIQLDNAFLIQSDLEHVWMREAFLREARLYHAKLSGAYLRKADLSGAYLNGADLKEANLTAASLSKTRLKGVDLRGADLRGADLRGAELNEARLNEVRLSRANLSGADLSETNLEDALSLEDTNLRGAIGLTKEQLKACKAKGAIIDEDTTASPSQASVSPATSSQNTNVQTPSTQGSLPIPDTNGSNASVSQQSNSAQISAVAPPASTDGSNTASSQQGAGASA